MTIWKTIDEIRSYIILYQVNIVLNTQNRPSTKLVYHLLNNSHILKYHV